MTLFLTPSIVAGAYEYLRTTPPFRGWRLPPAEEIEFKVVATDALAGYHDYSKNGDHVLAVSNKCHGHTATLMTTVAHEMIHVHQGERGTETAAQHNAQWNRLAKRVCRIHGFDEKEF